MHLYVLPVHLWFDCGGSDRMHATGRLLLLNILPQFTCIARTNSSPVKLANAATGSMSGVVCVTYKVVAWQVWIAMMLSMDVIGLCSFLGMLSCHHESCC